MTATADQVFAIQRLDPRVLRTHPRNVRTALGDLEGLTASIREQGVLEPLVVVPFSGEYFIVAGHRRAAAAIAAELDVVPCIVRFDISSGGDTDADTAAEIAAMLAENIHRQDLTAVEEARGVQAMLDLNVPLSKVAKATGLSQKRVKKALGVARLDEETAAAVVELQLDLDAAAAVALYADDPETAAVLIDAAAGGPGELAHALERAKQERENAAAFAKTVEELRAAGRTVLVEDDAQTRGVTRLSYLKSADGAELTAEEHRDCPGSAVTVVSTYWSGPRVDEVCTDPAKYGHESRYGAVVPQGKPETPEDKEAAKAERRLVIENNKAMGAASVVRRAWVKEFLARRSAPAAVLRFAVEAIAADPDALSRWLGSMYTQEGEEAVNALGLVRPSRRAAPAPSLTSGEHVPDGRLPLQLLAHIAAATEETITRDAWRRSGHDRELLAAWLRFLAGQGYTLSEVEQQIVDGAAK